MSLSVIMKCTSTIHQLAYGTTPDAFDEYLQMSANNDINVLDNSSLFDDLLNDTTLVVPYVVNGVGYEKGYYLADGIYPQWATFMKSFTVANDAKMLTLKSVKKLWHPYRLMYLGALIKAKPLQFKTLGSYAKPLQFKTLGSYAKPLQFGGLQLPGKDRVIFRPSERKSLLEKQITEEERSARYAST
nr:phospholipid-transporting ATPase 1 [Tanacetum cinerariifolium]